MSGPVREADIESVPADDAVRQPGLETWTSRTSDVGGATVRRALPIRSHRTVGAWCFVDHFGPAPRSASADASGMVIGPHPHIGLQTVTWLLAGELHHTDSTGGDQVIRPGQLNLMTAGHGVVHAEDSRGLDAAGLHGVQLWVAQPDRTRHGPPTFEHHAELPRVDLDRARATVLVGAFAGSRSSARTDTALVGVDLHLEGPSDTPVELPFDADHEHVLIVLEGRATVDDVTLPPDEPAYLGVGRGSVRLGAEPGTRALLLGGEPLGEDVFMWWNFVARDRDEIDAARQAWDEGDQRFGTVATDLASIPAPRPHWHASS